MERNMDDITVPIVDVPTTNGGPVGPSHDHQLWVNLSAFGDGNVFAVLPELLKKMLHEDSADIVDDFVDVILPSDDAWQTKIYYKLVEKQRLTDSVTPTEADKPLPGKVAGMFPQYASQNIQRIVKNCMFNEN